MVPFVSRVNACEQSGSVVARRRELPDAQRRVSQRAAGRSTEPNRTQPCRRVRHPIEFDPEASLELDQAARWYEDQRSGLGSDFLRASGRTIERLAEQRVLGLRIPTLDRSSLVRRAAVPRFPYQIVFEVIDGVLLAPAVAHDRQRPRYWVDRSISWAASNCEHLARRPPHREGMRPNGAVALLRRLLRKASNASSRPPSSRGLGANPALNRTPPSSIAASSGHRSALGVIDVVSRRLRTDRRWHSGRRLRVRGPLVDEAPVRAQRPGT